jgi:hypothetical protein
MRAWIKWIITTGVLASGGAAARADLVITEVMYNPASTETAWEWIELMNTGPAVDFAVTPYVIDDDNTSFHSQPNISAGVIPSGAVAVLYDADALSAAEFELAWGDVAHLVPVTDWAAMRLNNGSDTIGIWDDFAAYAGDHQTQLNAIVSFAYTDAPPFPADNDQSSIHLPSPFGDPADGASWRLSELGAGAWSSGPAPGNDGLDIGSPGVVLDEGPPCPADCTADGQVGVDDLLALLAAWGAADSPCDIDADGLVEVDDLVLLLESWGPCPR